MEKLVEFQSQGLPSTTIVPAGVQVPGEQVIADLVIRLPAIVLFVEVWTLDVRRFLDDAQRAESIEFPFG